MATQAAANTSTAAETVRLRLTLDARRTCRRLIRRLSCLTAPCCAMTVRHARSYRRTFGVGARGDLHSANQDNVPMPPERLTAGADLAGRSSMQATQTGLNSETLLKARSSFPYYQWMQGEGIPIHFDVAGIADVTTLERKP